MTKKQKPKNAGKARKSPKTAVAVAPKVTRPRTRDPRLPAVGTTIVRPYKGKDIRVKVLADGLEYEGTQYRSLTAVALAITGYPAVSGPAFFRLTEPATAAPKPKQTKSKEKPAAPASDVAQPAPESASPTN